MSCAAEIERVSRTGSARYRIYECAIRLMAKQGGTAKASLSSLDDRGVFLLRIVDHSSEPVSTIMREISNDTTEFYDAIAAYYPYFYRDWETQLQREGLGLRALFRNRGVTSILDASCGAGAQAIPLTQLGYQVTAVDPSFGMLRKLEAFAADYGILHRLTYRQGDFVNLTAVVDGPFDAVITKGNALPHLLLDAEIVTALRNFYTLLRPGGTLVIGMRDFAPFMEDRPRMIPGFAHEPEDGESGEDVITFDLWEWHDGPPVIATQSLFIVTGRGSDYRVIKRTVSYRPLSTDEVKVALLEVGFEDVVDQPDRAERVLVARKPLAAER